MYSTFSSATKNAFVLLSFVKRILTVVYTLINLLKLPTVFSTRL